MRGGGERRRGRRNRRRDRRASEEGVRGGVGGRKEGDSGGCKNTYTHYFLGFNQFREVPIARETSEED